MKIAVMQPYLFPYVGYFQLIKEADMFIFHDNVQYIKGGWINRNRILLDQDDHLFTFSLKNDSSFKNINKRYFTDDFAEQCNTFLRVLQTAYGNAPNFENTMHLVKKTLKIMKPHESENIAFKISRSIKTLSEYLKLKTDFIFASDIGKNRENTPQERIINICKKLNANKYVNLPGGKKLYDYKTFLEQGIELSFLEPGVKPYPQFSENFIPRLSIIDVIMFNNHSNINDLLNDYTIMTQSQINRNVQIR